MKTITALVLCSLLALIIAISAQAQGASDGKTQEHEKHMNMTKDTPSDQNLNVDIRLHDLELVTQDGQRVKFKSDVIGDKLVAMTFIYTSCTTICPVYNAIFTQLQDLLGERQGRDTILVTLTVDPARDIPRRMKKEAKKFGAKPGWYYLTGKKHNVDEVLRGLDSYYVDFEEHPPMALIGDGKTGTWRRFTGFPQAKHLLAMIDELKAARQ